MVQVSFGGVLHDDIEMVLIGEGLIQFDDMGVVEFAEDGNLGASFFGVLFLFLPKWYPDRTDMYLLHRVDLLALIVMHAVAHS